MRRKDREISDIKGIEEILLMCKTCHVAMVDNGSPYVVPLSYGYRIFENSGEKNILELYFHSAREGRKIDVLRQNDKVCFEISCEGEVVNDDNSCNTGYYFSSVIGFGSAVFIEEESAKIEALSVLFRHQTGRSVTFTPEQAKTVTMFKIVSDDFTGKRKPRPGN